MKKSSVKFSQRKTMRFFCNQKELLKNLQIVQKAVSTQSTLPVLSNILFEAEGQKVRICSTNLEISIKTQIDADVKNEGRITIPAKVLTSWVSFLKDGEIEVRNSSDNSILLKTKESDTKIKGISADEFPVLPKIENEVEFKISSQDLKKSINQVVFSCAHSSVRPVLSGVLIFGKGQQLHLVATDSYRLSEKDLKIKEKIKNEIYCIVPSKTMVELERIISSNENVKVVVSKNQILFSIGNVELISRLIEGKFPDYKQIIPKEQKTEVLIKKEDFCLVIKRVGIFAKENSNNIHFSFAKDKVEITTSQTEFGVEKSEIPAQIQGGENEVSLNGQFLLDALSVIESENIKVIMNEKLSPTIVKSEKDEDFTHVIMPLKI